MTMMMKHPFSLSLLLWLTVAGMPSSHALSMGNQVRQSLQPPNAPPVRPLHYGDLPTTMNQQLMMSTAAPLPANDVSLSSWKSQLLKASNAASLLCVLDCTILPFVTVVLPLFGLVAGSPAQMEWLHQLGHQVALWFVIPVGGSATALNYLYAHRKKRIALLGVLGLVLVLAANAPHAWIHAVVGHIPPILGAVLHAVHQGISHRVVNILGCACLLLSNYWSRQQGQCFLACCDPTATSSETRTNAELTAFVTYAHANRDRTMTSNELVLGSKDLLLRSDFVQ